MKGIARATLALIVLSSAAAAADLPAPSPRELDQVFRRIRGELLAPAHSNGEFGRAATGCGSGCHGNGADENGNVTVTLAGPTTVTPSQVASYTFTVTGGPGVGGGFNLLVSAGRLAPVGGTSQANGGGTELTHVDEFSRSWDFTWTAPAAPGTVTVDAVGLSTDGGGNRSGDSWDLLSRVTITVRPPTTCTDRDGDGWGDPGDATCPNGAARDCDDADAAVNPGASEACGDGIDNDCDTLTDCADATDCSVDADGDTVPAAPCGNDCDDADASNFPGNAENCGDAADNDCDALVDCLDSDCSVDADGDTVPAAPCGNDCDDADAANFPGNAEDCGDAADNDCDALADCLDSDCSVDADGDTVPAAPCGNDCDDADAANFPGNVEDCGDAADNDCDLAVDCDDTGCDLDPGCATADADGDTVPNTTDNCPLTFNPSQPDGDGDGIGDACDPDDEVVPVRVRREGPDVVLDWPRTPSDTGRPEYPYYTVHAGTLASLLSGTPTVPGWNHVMVPPCVQAPARTQRHAVANDGTTWYYLVAGWSAGGEGTYGFSDLAPGDVTGSGRRVRPTTQPAPACP